MSRKFHSKKEYEKCMALLKEHNNSAKVGRLMDLSASTVRNWKLNYSNPPGSRVEQLKTDIGYVGSLARKGMKVSAIAKEIGLPYNTALLLIKNNFNDTYENELKRKSHRLTNEQRKMDTTLAYILGVMFGDGCAKDPTKIVLYVKDRDFADVFALNMNKWCGLKPTINQAVARNRVFYRCTFYSNDISKFFNDIIKTKRVPDSILNSDDEIKCMFVRGFADSEGCVKKYVIGMYNKNNNILESIFGMLVSIGFDKNHLRVRRSNSFGLYELIISGKHNRKMFYDKIGFSIKRKQEKLRAMTGI